MTAAQPDVTAVAADTVVLATRNAAKLRELARILGAEDSASQGGGEQIRLAGLDEFPGAPDVPETGATFEENALLKARAIADYTGLPAVADDSGLCVDALNGMPGVLSARWAGGHGDDKANLELVLAQVADVPDTRLGARFVCAAALVVPGPREWVVTGQVEGRLVRAPRGSGLGWVTAEYAMLPRATNTRGDRESVKGRLGGRTQEISRLVGRSLRACVDYKALGENTIVIDCDVLQADGGTRTAAVTGGYVALAEAVAWLKGRKRTKGDPLLTSVSAVSVGIVDGEPRLDLCYEEDVAAQTDMNVVCTASGDFVEIQGTAEREPFSRDLLGQLLDLAVAGCGELTRLQNAALALSPGLPWPPPSRM